MPTEPAFRTLNRFFVSSNVTTFFVLINSLIILLLGFPQIHARYEVPLILLDYYCTIFFFLEVIFKINHHTWKGYWSSYWHRFDFSIVMLSSPMLLMPFLDTHEYGIILIFRFTRIIRVLKLTQFIPDYDNLIEGVKRAAKASISLVITLCIYNLILGVIACYLFFEFDPEHFGDPLLAIYSMFKVFTLEGWYEIPDAIAASSTPLIAFCARAFFVFAVLTGGIIGLSIANAIFVDEMLVDNTQRVQGDLRELRDKVEHLSTTVSTEHHQLLKDIKGLLEQR